MPSEDFVEAIIKSRERGPLRISDLPVKTADILATVPLLDDAYHQNISRSANRLVDEGRGHWVYQTGWESGKTLWAGEGETQVVKP